MSTDKDFEELKKREESYHRSTSKEPSILLVNKYNHLRTFQKVITFVISISIILYFFMIIYFWDDIIWDNWTTWFSLIGFILSIYFLKMVQKIIDFLFDLNNK